MAKRRRSNKKEPKGVIYLIVLACLAAVFHEPIANALRNKLPVPTEKTAKRAETTETTGNPLLPAPLKTYPNKYCTARAIPPPTTANTRYRIGWPGNLHQKN